MIFSHSLAERAVVSGGLTFKLGIYSRGCREIAALSGVSPQQFLILAICLGRRTGLTVETLTIKIYIFISVGRLRRDPDRRNLVNSVVAKPKHYRSRTQGTFTSTP